jgi:hypothetical protein
MAAAGIVFDSPPGSTGIVYDSPPGSAGIVYDSIRDILSRDDPDAVERFCETHQVINMEPILRKAISRDHVETLRRFAHTLESDDLSLFTHAVNKNAWRCVGFLIDEETPPAPYRWRDNVRFYEFISSRESLRAKCIEDHKFHYGALLNLIGSCGTCEELEGFCSRHPEIKKFDDPSDFKSCYYNAFREMHRDLEKSKERFRIFLWVENLEREIFGEVQKKDIYFLDAVSENGTPELIEHVRKIHCPDLKINHPQRRRLARASMAKGNFFTYKYWTLPSAEAGFSRPAIINRSGPVFREACAGGIPELIEYYWMDDPTLIPELLEGGNHAIISAHWNPAEMPSRIPELVEAVRSAIGHGITKKNIRCILQGIYSLNWFRYLDSNDIRKYDNRCISVGLMSLAQNIWSRHLLYMRLPAAEEAKS